jgi:hypothetical protein
MSLDERFTARPTRNSGPEGIERVEVSVLILYRFGLTDAELTE